MRSRGPTFPQAFPPVYPQPPSRFTTAFTPPSHTGLTGHHRATGSPLRHRPPWGPARTWASSGGRWRGSLSGTKPSGLSLRSLSFRIMLLSTLLHSALWLVSFRLPRPAASCAVPTPVLGSLRRSAPTRWPAARRWPTPCGEARAKPMEKLRLWIIPVENS